MTPRSRAGPQRRFYSGCVHVNHGAVLAHGVIAYGSGTVRVRAWLKNPWHKARFGGSRTVPTQLLNPTLHDGGGA